MRSGMRYKIEPQKVVEKLIPDKSVGELTHKKSLSLLDYAIILSTMYGIGSGLGIIAGTANSVMPNRKKKPAVFYTCLALLVLGTTRGYITASKSQRLKRALQELDIDEMDLY